MNFLTVTTSSTSYPIYIKEKFVDLKNAFLDANLNNRKIVIITDTNIEKLYLKEVLNLIKEFSKETLFYSFNAGEKSKTLDTIKEFYEFFTINHCDRKTVVVALGGGVCGDMAGFAAATYLRGVSYVQIPTSLLSQVDSSVGGKTGVDFMNNKNFVGAFYQPKFVYINIETLKTLPRQEFISGIGEVVKHGLIYDESYYDFICRNKEGIKNLDSSTIKNIIYHSCKIKADVVSKDEKEEGLREILNFGHTFGHVIESLCDFQLLHGYCVAIGMKAAMYLCRERNLITFEEFNNAIELLDYFELRADISKFTTNEIYSKMFSDKKTKDSKINLVLLNKIGSAFTDKNVSEEAIKQAILYIKE